MAEVVLMGRRGGAEGAEVARRGALRWRGGGGRG